MRKRESKKFQKDEEGKRRVLEIIKPNRRGRKPKNFNEYQEEANKKTEIYDKQLELVKQAISKLEENPKASIRNQLLKIETLDYEIDSLGCENKTYALDYKFFKDFELSGLEKGE